MLNSCESSNEHALQIKFVKITHNAIINSFQGVQKAVSVIIRAEFFFIRLSSPSNMQSF